MTGPTNSVVLAAAMTGAVSGLTFDAFFASAFAAGMAGGFVQFYHEMTEDRKMNIKRSFRSAATSFAGSVFVGGVCAHYLGPSILSIWGAFTGVELDIEQSRQGTVGGFLIGTFSTGIMGFVLGWLNGRTPKSGGQQ